MTAFRDLSIKRKLTAVIMLTSCVVLTLAVAPARPGIAGVEAE